MPKVPPITVLMPVYNGQVFLAEAIESILNQTFTDFEFLIIDDGSTDESLKIIQKYAQKDPRIKIVSNETNLKLITTLNKGISLARGEYIARMDADDISQPMRLERQFHFMQNHPEVIACGSAAWMIDKTGAVISKMRPPTGKILRYTFWKPSPIIHPSVILRKNGLPEVPFDLKYLHCEDYALWLKLGFKDPKYLANLNEPLLKYRFNEKGISISNQEEQSKNTFRAFQDTSGLNLSQTDFLNVSGLKHSISTTKWWKLATKIAKRVNYPVLYLYRDYFIYCIRKLLN
jgi:glycosyltransferase involved in cell wall biosynthesis